ncbi:FecCD family ABC transporter permease [Actinomadura madurae]|uniref:FecCD family ABC transporter permease n=1 Tax=Actinomadura madurae TaxID=1993 RepID=UPI003FD7D850
MGSSPVVLSVAGPEYDLDDLGASSRRRRYLLLLAGLSALFCGTAVAAVGMGAVSVPPATVFDIVGHHVIGSPADVTWRAAHDSIVWRVRLPRVLLGAAVGAGLAVTGTALQAMVRNMLADPYLLGVNSGGSTGAAAAILFGFGAGWGEHALQIAAFLGALAASLLVFVIARTAGRVTSTRLLMTGVAVGYALYALTSFLIFASDSAEGSRSVLFWLLGTLALAHWSVPLAVVLVAVALVTLTLALWGRRLDALAIGDETAHTLGISPARLRLVLLVLVSLAVGGAGGGVGQHRFRRAGGSAPGPAGRGGRASPGGSRRRADGRDLPAVGGPGRPHGAEPAGAADRHHHRAGRCAVPARPGPPPARRKRVRRS